MTSDGNRRLFDDYYLITNGKRNKVESKSAIRLALSDDGAALTIRGADGKDIAIAFRDLLAVKQIDCTGEVTKDGNRFRLIHYPLIKQKRQRLIYEIEASVASDSSKWVETIEQRICAAIPTHIFHRSTAKRHRHVIAIVNPFSGLGVALKIWNTRVKPVLDEANIDSTVLLTERAGHGRELARELDVSKYDALLVVSGDGLICEVLNGFLERSDYKLALKMPIGHIPGGTSNGLAGAICYQCNEPFPPRNDFSMEMALMVAHPYYLPLKLCHVETSYNGHMSMFMSVGWGLVSDIDIGSERFRWIGMARLHVESVIRILQLPTVAKYRGRVSYLPVGDKQLLRKTMLKYDVPRREFGENHFTYEQPASVMDENWTETELSTNHATTPDLEQIFRDDSSANHKKIPQLCDPVPDDWITIEDDFVYVCAVSLSHLGSDLPYIPSSKLDEDVLYLTIVDWNTVKTRMHVGQMMITIDTSRHLRHPCMQIIPVSACRIEPLSPGGYMTVDGEPVKTGPIQVAVSSLRATVIGREPRVD